MKPLLVPDPVPTPAPAPPAPSDGKYPAYYNDPHYKHD